MVSILIDSNQYPSKKDKSLSSVSPIKEEKKVPSPESLLSKEETRHTSSDLTTPFKDEGSSNVLNASSKELSKSSEVISFLE